MLDKGYLTELQNWRQQLDDTLRGEQSWLALVGLYWLEQGKNSFGSHHSNDVVFPDGSTPQHLGDFELRDEHVYLHVEHGNGILVDGEQVVDQELKLEGFDQPSEINVGSLTMIVVQRSERFGLRVWDRNNPRRKTFPGRIWHEPDESHLVKTIISTYDPPREMPITNILGDTSNSPLAGYVEFQLDGQKGRLDVIEGSDGRLVIFFKDQSSTSETYPTGRYLYSEILQNGTVMLDFYRAFNPPCAFTDFATCPLPPKQNHLTFRIEAGERYRKYSH